MEDFEIENFETYRQPRWTKKADDLLLWIRRIDFKEKFQIKNWSDVDIGIKSIWNEIAEDSRLNGHFTGVECWLRFCEFVRKYNNLNEMQETNGYHPKCQWEWYSQFGKYQTSLETV